MTRSGRRPGENRTREAILEAAKRSFGTRGYQGTSLRGVARAAGVDPSLVVHFFGSKDGLFEAALELPLDPPSLVAALLAGELEDLGARVVHAFLEVWDATPDQGPMLAMLRSAVSHPDSAASLRELLARVILLPLATGAGASDPELRAALLASQISGLALTRYVLRLEPLASLPPERVTALLGPTLQRYLTGPL